MRSCRAATRGAYGEVEEIFTTIAAQVDGEPCCAYVGADGAGHYVKMVHNGIEYADMQLIAEAYDLLRFGIGLDVPAIKGIFDDWNAGDLESFLIEITATVLGKTDEATGKPLVDVIVDQAEQKGTGRWTAQDALELGVPLTGITEAVFARSLSALRDQRREASGVLAGPQPGGAARVAGGRHPRRAVRVQGRRLRAGLRADGRRRAHVRVGPAAWASWRRSGAAAASSAPAS